MEMFSFYFLPSPFLHVVRVLADLPFVFHAMVLTTMLGLILSLIRR